MSSKFLKKTLQVPMYNNTENRIIKLLHVSHKFPEIILHI